MLPSSRLSTIPPAYLIDADAPVDVFLQQLLCADQVELEVLFDDAGAGGIGQ
jgi:hypothetical protein